DFSVDLIEFNGEKDHVHLLVNYLPKTSLSKLVNSLKGVSSRKLRQDCPDAISSIYYRRVLWSPSYFAGSVGGASISVVRQYIKQQKEIG
ncbi:MAG: IS200/IS605 family transposase, partial [Chlamydiota bacterium]